MSFLNIGILNKKNWSRFHIYIIMFGCGLNRLLKQQVNDERNILINV